MSKVVDLEEARFARGVPYELAVEDGDVVLRIRVGSGLLGTRTYRFTPAVAKTLARGLLALAASATDGGR